MTDAELRSRGHRSRLTLAQEDRRRSDQSRNCVLGERKLQVFSERLREFIRKSALVREARNTLLFVAHPGLSPYLSSHRAPLP